MIKLTGIEFFIVGDDNQSADVLIDNYYKALHKANELNPFFCEFRYNGEIRRDFKYGKDKWEVIANLQKSLAKYHDFSIISVHKY